MLHLLDFKKLNDKCIHDYLELALHCINHTLQALNLLACISNNNNIRITCEWHFMKLNMHLFVYQYRLTGYSCEILISPAHVLITKNNIHIKITIKIVLGNILMLSLQQGIEFKPVTLLRIPLYLYYVFRWLRGGHKVIKST